jgi:two-component system, NtrC family, sensor kinase
VDDGERAGPVEFDLSRFELSAALALLGTLQQLGTGAGSLEEVAGRVVQVLHEQLLVTGSGERACALVRLFMTVPLGMLPPDLREFAAREAAGQTTEPATPCLVLFGTAGDRPEWSLLRASVHHQAIPLVSERMAEQFPMISRLIHDLGVPVMRPSGPGGERVPGEHHGCNVFYVPRAQDSPLVPAQQEFVVPYGIQSVLGFGGWLPNGALFATVLFSRVPVPTRTAELFRRVALGVRQALLPWLDRPWR